MRHGVVMAEARCLDPGSVTAMQAMEQQVVQAVPTGVLVDRLVQLQLVESWFRGRNGAQAIVADSVVGALKALASDLRVRTL